MKRACIMVVNLHNLIIPSARGNVEKLFVRQRHDVAKLFVRQRHDVANLALYVLCLALKR